MKLKKKKKAVRMRGSRTHGWAMKKHKGSGNRGGKGMAGTGKRADHRKTWVIRYKFPYFGKQGFTSKSTKKKINKVINLEQIQNNYKPGEINLSEYKLLGKGTIKDKFIIKAKSASTSAIDKVEKAGGKIEIIERAVNQEKTNAETKEEGKEDKRLTKKNKKIKSKKQGLPTLKSVGL